MAVDGPTLQASISSLAADFQAGVDSIAVWSADKLVSDAGYDFTNALDNINSVKAAFDAACSNIVSS